MLALMSRWKTAATQRRKLEISNIEEPPNYRQRYKKFDVSPLVQAPLNLLAGIPQRLYPRSCLPKWET